MEAALAITLFVASCVAGWALARAKATFEKRAAVYLLLFCASLLIAAMPYFIRDPKTWTRTLMSGVYLEGIPLFLVHVLPAILTYNIRTAVMRKKARSCPLS
jgi:hypothetical protein